MALDCRYAPLQPARQGQGTATAQASRLRGPIATLAHHEGFDFNFKSAEVATHQLKAIGLAIDLQVVDWATLNRRVQNPELWDVASTAVILEPDPGSHLALRSSWWGTWCLEEKELLLRQLQEESDADQRKRLVDRLQAVFYEDVGYVKMGDGFSLDVVRRELRGELRIGPRYCFWNSWLTT